MSNFDNLIQFSTKEFCFSFRSALQVSQSTFLKVSTLPENCLKCFICGELLHFLFKYFVLCKAMIFIDLNHIKIREEMFIMYAEKKILKVKRVNHLASAM